MRGGLEVEGLGSSGAEWIFSFLFFLSALYFRHDSVLETKTVVPCTSLPPVEAVCCFDEKNRPVRFFPEEIE